MRSPSKLQWVRWGLFRSNQPRRPVFHPIGKQGAHWHRNFPTPQTGRPVCSNLEPLGGSVKFRPMPMDTVGTKIGTVPISTKRNLHLSQIKLVPCQKHSTFVCLLSHLLALSASFRTAKQDCVFTALLHCRRRSGQRNKSVCLRLFQNRHKTDIQNRHKILFQFLFVPIFVPTIENVNIYGPQIHFVMVFSKDRHVLVSRVP